MGVYRRKDGRRTGKVWWISYFKGGRQYRESTGSRDKRVATRILAVRQAEVVEERWRLPRSKSPQLGSWFKDFLKSISHGPTRARYKSSLNNLLSFFGEKIRMGDITPEAVFRFQQKRLEDGVGKATVNRDVTTLSSCFTRAKAMRLVSHNPCRDVGQLNERRDRRRAKPLSYDEEERIKQLAPPLLRMLITLLAETGMRVQKEALPLRWSDLSLDSEPAWIRILDSKTAAGVRTVWLTEYCRNALQKWREFLTPDFSPFVFPSPRNASTHFRDYKTAWRTALKKTGLSYRIYDLRATFASRANQCRATGLTLAHLLGHANTNILPVYVRPLDENTRALISALDAARDAHRIGTRTFQ
jgi:integrase